jgi:hypothetical protein
VNLHLKKTRIRFEEQLPKNLLTAICPLKFDLIGVAEADGLALLGDKIVSGRFDHNCH